MSAPANAGGPWPWREVLGGAAAIEAVTLALRFGAGLQSTRDTAALAGLTGGWRFHHGYLGLLLLLLALFPAAGSPWRRRAGIVGGALLLSDLVHHFLVLWPLTGSPQFDLRYPG